MKQKAARGRLFFNTLCRAETDAERGHTKDRAEQKLSEARRKGTRPPTVYTDILRGGRAPRQRSKNAARWAAFLYAFVQSRNSVRQGAPEIEPDGVYAIRRGRNRGATQYGGIYACTARFSQKTQRTIFFSAFATRKRGISSCSQVVMQTGLQQCILGISSPGELLDLMEIFNRYPLRVLTVHGRTAKQMYEGNVDLEAFGKIAAASANPVMYNGDITLDENDAASPTFIGNLEKTFPSISQWMVGRSFIAKLGARDDAAELLRNYIDMSCEELHGDNPVLGRMKELLSYWAAIPKWKRLWPMVKICRSVNELRCITG